jgi:hypothetical protein
MPGRALYWVVVAFVCFASESARAEPAPASGDGFIPPATLTEEMPPTLPGSMDSGAEFDKANAPGFEPQPPLLGDSRRQHSRQAGPRFADTVPHLELRVGGGTLVGLIGATVGANVEDWLELGGGAGFGLGGPAGGAYARFRPARLASARGRRLHAVTAEVGYSLSKFAWSSEQGNLFSAMGHDSRREERTADLAHFAQYDVGWETRSAGGFSLRVAIGVAIMLNSGNLKCKQMDGGNVVAEANCPSGFALPTLTFGVGF